MPLKTCDCSLPCHVSVTYNSIKEACRVFCIVIGEGGKRYLPRICISSIDSLPKSLCGYISVNVRGLIKEFGLSGSVALLLRNIIDHSKWHIALLVLSDEKFG